MWIGLSLLAMSIAAIFLTALVERERAKQRLRGFTEAFYEEMKANYGDPDE